MRELVGGVSTATRRPDESWTRAARRNAGQLLGAPPWRTPVERRGSYSSRTIACPNGQVAPRLARCSGWPSILVGRPSWVSTRIP